MGGPECIVCVPAHTHMDHAGDPPQQAQQQVDEQLCATAVHHGHPDWRQEQSHDDGTAIGHGVCLCGTEGAREQQHR